MAGNFLLVRREVGREPNLVQREEGQGVLKVEKARKCLFSLISRPSYHMRFILLQTRTDTNHRSALLGMLPPPKRKLPASKTTPASSASLAVNKSMATSSLRAKPAANLPAPPGYVAPPGEVDSDSDDEGSGDKMNGQMLPPALQRQAQAKAKSTKVKETSLDLFGLGPSSTLM